MNNNQTQAWWAHPIVKTILLPLLTTLLIGFGTGYLGAERAIAVLVNRVDRIERVQDSLVEQQKEDGKTMVRIETKVDMLLNRTLQ